MDREDNKTIRKILAEKHNHVNDLGITIESQISSFIEHIEEKKKHVYEEDIQTCLYELIQNLKKTHDQFTSTINSIKIPLTEIARKMSLETIK